MYGYAYVIYVNIIYDKCLNHILRNMLFSNPGKINYISLLDFLYFFPLLSIRQNKNFCVSDKTYDMERPMTCIIMILMS